MRWFQFRGHAASRLSRTVTYDPGTFHRYHNATIILHWISALLAIFMLALGFFMTRGTADLFLKFELYQLHKSLGFTLLLITVIRIGWRLSNTIPEYASNIPEWTKRAASIAHLTMYTLLLLIPISGWMMVSTAKIAIPTLYFGFVEIPHLSFLAAGFESETGALHTLLVSILGLLALGHVSAALVHTVLFKDRILHRMLPDLLNNTHDVER